jgi:hypothetical protein
MEYFYYSPATWILLSDVEKYFVMSWKHFVMWHNIIWEAMEYVATSHPWFVMRWTMAYWLWTWVWPRKSSITTSCKHLKTFLLIEGCILSSFVQPICLMLLDNNYNIFKNVEMGGNYILQKYLMKINFSNYIRYLTNMCWNGRNIISKYTTLYNDWKVTKWRKKQMDQN